MNRDGFAGVFVGFGRGRRGVVARPLIPGDEFAAAVVEGGAAFGDGGSGLFEVVGDVLGQAEIADLTRPEMGHGSIAGAGFAADDKPVESGEIDLLRPRADQGFSTDEEGGGGTGAEVVQSVDDAGVLYAGSHPHIRRPFFGGPGGGELGAFGQYLECVLGEIAHDGEDLPAVFVGDEGVEEIRHGIYEDAGGFFELVRVAELVGFKQDVFSFVLLCPGLFRPAVFEGEPFGVAVAAAVADAGAAMYWIPGDGRPANRGLIHYDSPFC